MNEVSIIGLDLAKNVFQAHGAGVDGTVVFRRKLSRAQLLKFMSGQPPALWRWRHARVPIFGVGQLENWVTTSV